MPTFNEQNISLSFGVLSDVHLTGDENLDIANFNKALQTINEKTNGDVDAICFAGDMLNRGREIEAAQFINAFVDTFPKESKTEIFYAIGNHEHYGSPHAEIAKKALYQGLIDVLGAKAFGSDLEDSSPIYGNRHAIIKGYHFIAIEPETYTPHEKKFSDETLSWFKQALSTAQKENPDHYIFVFTHAMIFDTCYGSVLDGPDSMWNTTELTDILSNYPQVITFGGHLHFPLNDERSIMQKSFTSLGTASVSYMAIERGSYEDMRSATVMNDCRKFSQGLLAEIDNDGNIRFRKLDFYNDSEIRAPWILSKPDSLNHHLMNYTTDRAKDIPAPKLKSGKMTYIVSDEGIKELIVEFDAAITTDLIHHYVIQVLDGDEELKTIKILADFYLHPFPTDMKKTWSRNLGAIEGNHLSIRITAVDSWDHTDSITIQ